MSSKWESLKRGLYDSTIVPIIVPAFGFSIGIAPMVFGGGLGFCASTISAPLDSFLRGVGSGGPLYKWTKQDSERIDNYLERKTADIDARRERGKINFHNYVEFLPHVGTEIGILAGDTVGETLGIPLYYGGRALGTAGNLLLSLLNYSPAPLVSMARGLTNKGSAFEWSKKNFDELDAYQKEGKSSPWKKRWLNAKCWGSIVAELVSVPTYSLGRGVNGFMNGMKKDGLFKSLYGFGNGFWNGVGDAYNDAPSFNIQIYN